MTLVARIPEKDHVSAADARHPMPDPGFLHLYGELVEHYGRDAVTNAPLDVSVEVGPESGVLLLYVAQSNLDAASQATAQLSVEVEEKFGERYTVVVLAIEEG